MFNKTKFDISHENFDIFFANHLASITPEAKEKLPRDVVYKLWRGGGSVVNLNKSTALSFISKLWILWKCFRKNIWIIVEDDNGLSPQQFEDLNKAVTKKRVANSEIENGVAEFNFATANKELCQTLDCLNKISVSPTYNYLMKPKNMPPNKVAVWQEQMNYVIETFVRYERFKKKWITDYNLSLPEYYVLICCYSGRSIRGADIYKIIFKGVYGSSATKIKMALGNLQRKGYIVKEGQTVAAKFTITSLGTELLNKIFSKYVLDNQ